jgi:hypothetical protein
LAGSTRCSERIQARGVAWTSSPRRSAWARTLKLENFPFEGYYIFEWYVAIDEKTRTSRSSASE